MAVSPIIAEYRKPASSSYSGYHWIANTYSKTRTDRYGDSNQLQYFEDNGIGYYSAHLKSLSGAPYEHNAQQVYNLMTGFGWTPNAVCGLMGNVQSESRFNPGAWEGYKNHNAGYLNFGIGIVQWSNPNYKLTDTLYEKGGESLLTQMYSLYTQCLMLSWMSTGAVASGWRTTSKYPLSFGEFSRSTLNPGYLGEVFAYNYERSRSITGGNGPAAQKEALAQRNARSIAWWIKYNPTTPPDPESPDVPDVPAEPDPIIPPEKTVPIWLLLASRKRRYFKL